MHCQFVGGEFQYPGVLRLLSLLLEFRHGFLSYHRRKHLLKACRLHYLGANGFRVISANKDVIFVRPLHKLLHAFEPLIRHIAERQICVLTGGNDGAVVRKDIESAFPVI